jgi:hypothetical protein
MSPKDVARRERAYRYANAMMRRAEKLAVAIGFHPYKVSVSGQEIVITSLDKRIATGRVSRNGIWRVTLIGTVSLPADEPEMMRIAKEAQHVFQGAPLLAWGEGQRR